MLNEDETIFRHEEIVLQYVSEVNAYMITLPTGRWFAIPAENIEDLQAVLAAAKEQRDLGHVEEEY